MRTIPIAKPQIGWKERRAVTRVLKSLSLAQGPEVKAFESEFSKVVGDRECVAVNSGTSALHLALIALGVSESDEVLVPSFTFAATANVVKLVKAVPVFVDIDPKTFCIDIDHLVKRITPKTKAIIVVHLYGLPANMLKIKEIAKKFALIIIEDAAQAHLASIGKEVVGTFGDAAAFSFYPTKNMTSGEGGMIVLANSEVARTCRMLRNQGMEKKYANEIVGFNLRMTDIHAAIGRIQLKRLPTATKRRIENAAYLVSTLNIETTPYVPEGFIHVFHQFTVRIEKNRDSFSKELTNLGIGNEVYYPTPVHLLPSFQSTDLLDQTEKACKEVLSIPVHPGLSSHQLRKVASTFNRVIDSRVNQ